MSNMLGRSKIFLRQSKDCLNKIAEDDCNMDIACFNAHQALELLLKHIIESYGLQAPKTHMIDDLLVYAETGGFKYSDSDSLKNLAWEVNKWETVSRYGSGIKTTTDKIKQVYVHIQKIENEFLEDINKNSFSNLKSLSSKIN